jgi:hypothetical protein
MYIVTRAILSSRISNRAMTGAPSSAASASSRPSRSLAVEYVSMWDRDARV